MACAWRSTPEQTASLNAKVKFGNTPDNFFGGYHTVEEMQQFLDQEVAAHPNLAEKVDYGDSWCKAHPGQCTLPEPNNGYDLLALHITNRNIPGPKPVFWLEANIHAREIAPPEIAVDYISYLLDNYNSDADAHWLVDWHDIYVVPTLNPDGHHIVEAGGGGQNPYYQRKNANDTNGCTTWPPAIGNQFGTDLNRNFPFLWNCCGGSSSRPMLGGLPWRGGPIGGRDPGGRQQGKQPDPRPARPQYHRCRADHHHGHLPRSALVLGRQPLPVGHV